jgi:hypothetical protein
MDGQRILGAPASERADQVIMWRVSERITRVGSAQLQSVGLHWSSLARLARASCTAGSSWSSMLLRSAITEALRLLGTGSWYFAACQAAWSLRGTSGLEAVAALCSATACCSGRCSSVWTMPPPSTVRVRAGDRLSRCCHLDHFPKAINCY